MRHPAAIVTLAVLSYGCDAHTNKTRTPDCGVYFDYAGTYASTLEMTEGDAPPVTSELNILIQQNGPSISLANVLGVADSEGMSFGHSWEGLDYWINDGEPMTVTYSGASRPREPFTIDLEVVVEYPNLDGWGYTLDYVVYLGDEVVY